MAKTLVIPDMKPSKQNMGEEDLIEIGEELPVEPQVIAEPPVVDIQKPEIPDMTPMTSFPPTSKVETVKTDELLSLADENKLKFQKSENLGQPIDVNKNIVITPNSEIKEKSPEEIEASNKKYLYLLEEMDSLENRYANEKDTYSGNSRMLQKSRVQYEQQFNKLESELNTYPQYKYDKAKQRLASSRDYVKGKYGNFKENLLVGTGTNGRSDEEYAKKGGYKGEDKSTLDLHINTIDEKLNNINNRRNIVVEELGNENDTIESATRQIKDLMSEIKSTNDPVKIDKLNTQIRIEESKITNAKREREYKTKELEKLSNSKIEALDLKSKYETKRNEFYAYKDKGKKDFQKESGFASKASKYGVAAQESVNNVFTPPGGKGILAKDWYGSKGFMSQPFSRQSITTSPLEPVRTKLSNLDALTRSTGSSVGRDMVNSIVNIRKGNVIAPLGVPGTIGRSGISDRYNYNTPLKRIQVSDVYTNVNRDFLPTIMERKVAPLQMQANPKPIQYQQMVQPDGTVINVPVQQRKNKKANPVNRMNIGINNIVQSTGKSKPQVDKKSTAIDNIVNSINKMGTVKPNKDVIPKRKQGINMFTVKHYDFGLSLNKKPEVQVEVVEPKERKQKKVDPLVNILSNINNMTKKKKKI